MARNPTPEQRLAARSVLAFGAGAELRLRRLVSPMIDVAISVRTFMQQ